MRTVTVVSATLAVAGWCFAAAAPASADAISVTASPNPAAPGAQITVTNSGETGETGGVGAFFIFDYYELNTDDCAPTSADARTRGTYIGQNGGYATGPGFPFSQQMYFTPPSGSGAYHICAYLYPGAADSGPPAAVASTLLQVLRPTPAHHVKRHTKKHQKKRARRH